MKCLIKRGRDRDNTILYGTTVGLSVNRLLRGQLSYLSKHGWDVHVASSPGDELTIAQRREQFTAHPLPMSREIAPWKDLVSLTRWIRLLLRVRPSVTNVSTPKAALLGAIAAKITGVPRRVYVVRGLRLEGSSGPLKRVLALLERLTISLSTDIIAVSPSLEKALRAEQLISARRRVHVLGAGSSNGVDAEAVRAMSPQDVATRLRAELKLGNHVVIGYLGRISSDKGVDVLARAMERPPLANTTGWSLLCVGGIEHPDALEELRASGAPVVHVDHTLDPWRYLGAMDILCLPTRREGFPNVVLEAGSLGIPAVTTNATGAVDAVIHKVTGLIVPVEDSESLSAALASLVEDATLRKELGKASRTRVERDFRQEAIWGGLDALYRSTTTNRS